MKTTIAAQGSSHVMWLAVLGACALWLVVQNAVLITILTLTHPGLPAALVVGAARTLARVVSVAGELAASIATAAPGWMSSNMLSTLTGGLL